MSCFVADDAGGGAVIEEERASFGEESGMDVCRADANFPLRKSEMEAAADFGASGMALELIAVSADWPSGVEAGRPARAEEEVAEDDAAAGGKYSASDKGVTPR